MGGILKAIKCCSLPPRVNIAKWPCPSQKYEGFLRCSSWSRSRDTWQIEEQGVPLTRQAEWNRSPNTDTLALAAACSNIIKKWSSWFPNCIYKYLYTVFSPASYIHKVRTYRIVSQRPTYIQYLALYYTCTTYVHILLLLTNQLFVLITQHRTTITFWSRDLSPSPALWTI